MRLKVKDFTNISGNSTKIEFVIVGGEPGQRG